MMLSEDYLLDSYRSLVNNGAWNPFENGTIAIVDFIGNMFYTLLKMAWSVFDGVIYIVSQVNFLTLHIDTVFDVAKSLYSSFITHYFALISAFAVLYYMWQYVTNNERKANRFMLLFFFLMMVNHIFYAQGSYLIKQASSAFSSIETIVVQSAVHPINEDLGQAREARLSDQVFRDYLFNETVQKTFAQLNFGQVEFNKDTMGEYLISASTPVGDLESSNSKVVQNVQTGSQTNVYLLPLKGIEKIFIAFFGMLNTMVVGGLIALIYLIKVLCQLAILALVFLLPVVSIISLLPRFNHALFNLFGKMLSLFLGASMVSFVAFLFFFFYRKIDVAMSSLVTGFAAWTQYLMSFGFKGLFTWATIKYRGKLISVVTGGGASIHSLPDPVQHVLKEVERKTEAVGSVGMERLNEFLHTNPFRDKTEQKALQDFDGNKEDTDMEPVSVEQDVSDLAPVSDSTLFHDDESKYDTDMDILNKEERQKQEIQQRVYEEAERVAPEVPSEWWESDFDLISDYEPDDGVGEDLEYDAQQDVQNDVGETFKESHEPLVEKQPKTGYTDDVDNLSTQPLMTESEPHRAPEMDKKQEVQSKDYQDAFEKELNGLRGASSEWWDKK